MKEYPLPGSHPDESGDAWSRRFTRYVRRPTGLSPADLAAVELASGETGIAPGLIIECFLRGSWDVLTAQQAQRLRAWGERFMFDARARSVYEAILASPDPEASATEQLAYLFLVGQHQPTAHDNDTPGSEPENTGGH